MAIIPGTNGSDNLKGTGDPDRIEGFGGVDNLTGGFGADTLDGGASDDRAIYGDSNVGVEVILGGSGQGSGSGGTAQGDILISIENITGSSFNDFIIGDVFDNNIDGGGGFDTLKGGGGNDFLRGSGLQFGDEGEDTLRGGALNDTLHGGLGDDTLDGRDGADLIDGGEGIDTVTYEGSEFGVVVTFVGTEPESDGFAEGDRLISIENVIGTSQTDFLIGEGVANKLEGRSGNDILIGNGGNDTLRGDIGNDDLTGGANDDLLIGGFGADDHDGGTGIDTVNYIESDVGVTVNLNANTGGGGDAQGDTFVGIENVEGSFHDDVIFGDNGANVLFGDIGEDTLKGLGGADTLLGDIDDDFLVGGDGDDKMDGQSGADTMAGGAGNDLYAADAGDTIDEASLLGSGVDTVVTRIAFSLSSALVKGNVENLTLLGNANISAVGNALANTIVGNSGNNNINGNSGADLMRGMAGIDHYVVNDVGDVVDESVAGSGGLDDILSFVSINLSGPNVRGAVENVSLASGTGALNVTGNNLINEISGNNGANVIAGLGGNDELTGGLGADSFLFNTAPNFATNRDIITDFSVADDTIRLENTIFTALGDPGTLAASGFHIGKVAHDANDRIIYDDDFGSLFYDADGTGAQAAVRFAIVDDDLAMTNLDFLVV